jgi:putative chitinase
MVIRTDQLIGAVPTLKKDRAEYLADKMNFIFPTYGINSYDILHELIANVAHESGGFRIKEENMNYTAKRLMEVWPSRFKTIQAATPFQHEPRKLANNVYGGRMGNVQPDDGWSFRGGGFMQLTGRDTYTRYQKFLAFDTVENMADAVRSDDYYAIDSAAWFFAVEKGLIQLAKEDKFVPIVRKINGGTIGLRDREYYYARAKQYFK